MYKLVGYSLYTYGTTVIDKSELYHHTTTWRIQLIPLSRNAEEFHQLYIFHLHRLPVICQSNPMKEKGKKRIDYLKFEIHGVDKGSGKRNLIFR